MADDNSLLPRFSGEQPDQTWLGVFKKMINRAVSVFKRAVGSTTSNESPNHQTGSGQPNFGDNAEFYAARATGGPPQENVPFGKITVERRVSVRGIETEPVITVQEPRAEKDTPEQSQRHQLNTRTVETPEGPRRPRSDSLGWFNRREGADIQPAVKMPRQRGDRFVPSLELIKETPDIKPAKTASIEAPRVLGTIAKGPRVETPVGQRRAGSPHIVDIKQPGSAAIAAAKSKKSPGISF